ncbi:hypothetical protein [Streptacidiphilus sp. MAP12-16]|uniref:hypothetical protein n=1 Tax=Streptacidiphilus sp. MAP12-16 TaxID=3156300 RepID=UPI0035182C2A
MNRLSMFLEDAGIKLSSVVSDITGKSPRLMLDALVAGERDPRALADLALGSLQGKVPPTCADVGSSAPSLSLSHWLFVRITTPHSR